MFQDTGKITDSKLIVLYTLNKAAIPLTKPQLTDMILENGLIDYFTLQQCISELEAAELTVQTDYQKKNCYMPTDSGKKALDVFSRRINKSVRNVIDQYIDANRESLKKEDEIIAEYSRAGDKEYIVSLKVIERSIVLIDLKLSVVSAKQAKQICEKWKNSSETIYSQIISTLKS